MTDTSSQPIVFTPSLIGQTGRIGAVLTELMDQQALEIQSALRQQYDQAPGALVTTILNSLITLDGTKQSRTREELFLLEYPNEMIAFCLDKLEQGRIIREYAPGEFELVHDTLAKHLFQKMDTATAAMLEATESVKNAHEKFGTTKDYLGKGQLEIVDQYEDEIRKKKLLRDEEWAFVERSRVRVRRNRNMLYSLLIFSALAAVVMSFLYYDSLQKNKKIEEQGISLKQQSDENVALAKKNEANKEFSEKTSYALRSSKNDRTSAFFRLFGLFDTADLVSIDTPVFKVAESIKRDLLADFSLYPFYQEKHGPRRQREVQKVIVDDSLHYLLGFSNESPMVRFFNFDPLANSGLKPSALLSEGLLFPLSKREELGGNVLDLIYLDQRRSLVSVHHNGKIWEWSLDREERRYVDSIGGAFKAITPFKQGFLIAMDSSVFQVDLRQKGSPPEFKIGFDRPVKLLVADPTGSGFYAVVKENANEIFLCHAGDTSRKITEIYDNIDPEPVTCLAFSPDGQTLVAGFEGDILKSWTRRRPDILTEFRGHEGLVSCVTFSPDGKYILSGSWDQSAILWKRSGEIVKKLVGHQHRITSIAYTRTGNAVTCAMDDDIKYWPLEPLSDLSRSFENRIIAMAVSPTDPTVAFSVLGDEGFFRLWNWETGKMDTIWQPRKYRSDRKGQITDLVYYKYDGRNYILAASRNTQLLTLIDLETRKGIEDYRSGNRDNIPLTDGISCVDINRNYLLIGNKRTYLQVVDGMKKFTNNHMLLLRKRNDPANTFIKISLPAGVNVACFSPDDRFVAAGCDNGRIYLWDMQKKEFTDTLYQHSSRISAMTFSSDGQYLLTGGADNAVILWIKTKSSNGTDSTFANRQYRILEGKKPNYIGHKSDVHAVDFANQFKGRFISAGADKTVKIWEGNRNTPEVEHPSIIRHLEEIRHARYSWDDRYIVTGSDDGTVRVWAADDAESVIKERILGAGGSTQ